MSNKLQLFTRASATQDIQQFNCAFDARSLNEEERTVELSFSSETPVARWFGNEILDHAPGAARLDRLNNGGALLLEHDRGKQIGVVVSAKIGSDRKGRATVKFSRSAKASEIFDDIRDGIRRLVSVGYRIHKKVTEENANGVETVRVTDWEPYELSIVSIPADESVGVGRSENNPTGNQNTSPNKSMNRQQILDALRAAGITFDESLTTDALRALLPTGGDNNGTASQSAQQPNGGQRSHEPTQPARQNIQVIHEDPTRAIADGLAVERRRVADIQAIAESAERQGVNNLDVRAAIASGQPADDFRATAFDALVKRQNAYNPASPTDLSRNERRDLSGFSMIRGISAIVEGRTLDGLEREMHQEAVREANSSGITLKGNFHIPSMALQHGRRDMTATGGSNGDQGGTLIETQHGSFIDLLYSKMVLRDLGAQFLSGLTGNIDLPKLVTGSTVSNKAENAAADESSPTTGSVSLTPNRATTFVEVSQQLLAQSSLSVEAMLRNDLATALALLIERHGIDAILADSGIGSVAGGTDGAAPTWVNIVGLETLVSTANADIGSLGYLTNPKVRGKLKLTQQFAGTNGVPVWTPGDEPLNGYRAAVTSQVPSNLVKGTSGAVCSAIVFGNFSDLIIAQWGGISIMANPYAKDTEGLVRLTLNSYHDSAIRRVASFAAMKDALTA